MTHRSRHLEEALRECAGRGVGDSGDPWPDIKERLADRLTKPAGYRFSQRRPSRRGLVPRTRAGWILVALLVGLFSTAAYAASELLVESDLTIEDAALQSGKNGQEIVVRARASGDANLPECILVEGPVMEALQRAERGGEPPKGRIDSVWPDGDLTESYDVGNETVFVFHGGPGARQENDPRNTPFFAMCSAGTGPGGTGPAERSAVAHVRGTPGSDATLASEERDFVKKDMASQKITPPTATLSSGDRSVKGAAGPYCWSPGARDEEDNALWCWNEEVDEGVPPRNETLRVSAGSTLLFDFGGESGPDSVTMGAYPLVYGKLSGQPATGLRVDDRRVEIPSDLPPGGYSVAVWISGPEGEATYHFRIAVENAPGEQG